MMNRVRLPPGKPGQLQSFPNSPNLNRTKPPKKNWTNSPKNRKKTT